jgi:nucleoside-diphosphate-sugar epimerase
MDKFLITGGAGFIGSHIAKHLVQNGCFVRILDNFSTGKEENLTFAKTLKSDRFELQRGDITNPQDCAKACQGMDFVLHQAALLSVAESMKDPLKYNHVNINGTLFMLQAALEHKIKRFVLASSAAVYGDAKHFPLREDHCPLLISPYALSKLAGEYYCRIFSAFSKMQTVCLRYFNVFGPGQSMKDDYASVIPKFIHHFLKSEPIPIFGSGLQSRDFVYIQNVVSANILAAYTSGITHEVFNVASGEVITILELAECINRICSSHDTQFQFHPPRAGDIFKIDADISKIQQVMGYKPLVTFEEGLKETVNYFQQQGEGPCHVQKSQLVS